MSDTKTVRKGASGQEWTAKAACRNADPETFFPNSMEDAGPAKRVCASCTVALECFQFALGTKQQWGVWAGTTPKQRAALRKLAAAAGKPNAGPQQEESAS